MSDLVGPTEIAERAGVKPDTVLKWRLRHALTFPVPLVTLSSGPVWDWADVEEWLRMPRRSGRPAKEAVR